MEAQLTQIQQQIAAYQADIANLLTLMCTLQQQEQGVITWLSLNPA